jgi:hypothetical protein
VENKKILVFGFLIVLICVGFSGCVQDSDDVIENDFDENWETETVDESGWVGIDPMIAVDSDNNPHIAYYDQGNRNLKYAYFDGSSWTAETVDSGGDVGEEPGIDVDSNGIPHISYEDHTNSALRYATKKNGVWDVTTIDSVTVDIEAMSTSLKVDSNDNIHIAYSFGIHDPDQYDEDVFRYAFYNGNVWDIESVRKTGSDVIIDIDSFNNPHISFKGDMDDGDRIMYATKSSGSWNVEVVDNAVKAEGDTGIAVQSDGIPHIVYHDYENGLIKYATKTESTWTILTVVDNQDNQEGLKIDVDSNNVAHVVYSNCQGDDDNEYLIYAKKEGSNWVKENVFIMSNPAIVVDSLGTVHIAHNACVEGNPLDYDPDYSGDETEIEILKYSKRE